MSTVISLTSGCSLSHSRATPAIQNESAGTTGRGNVIRNSELSVLFLTADASQAAGTGALRILALALPPDQFQVTIGFLGRAGRIDHEDEVKAGNIECVSVPYRNALDIAGARRLKKLGQQIQPEIVHAWGARAARASRFLVSRDVGTGNWPRLVISHATAIGGGISGWLATRRIRRADRVIPLTRAEGERYRRVGVSAERLTLIAPAVSHLANLADPEAFDHGIEIPDPARLIVTSGGSQSGSGPKDAIIVFDMLRYEANDLFLAVTDGGNELAHLEQFARSLAFDDFRVRFARPGSSRDRAIARCCLALVTSPSDGIEMALAAMAAAKPVLGWASADLKEIVEDKVTGLLVPYGDRAALAAAVRAVLTNPAYARRLGEAGRARAAGRFGLPRMVDQYTRLYQELVGDGRAR